MSLKLQEKFWQADWTYMRLYQEYETHKGGHIAVTYYYYGDDEPNYKAYERMAKEAAYEKYIRLLKENKDLSLDYIIEL